MPANDGNDYACVFLDIFPSAVAVGFIAYFKDDVWNVGVFLGNLVEESNGFGKVFVGIVVF